MARHGGGPDEEQIARLNRFIDISVDNGGRRPEVGPQPTDPHVIVAPPGEMLAGLSVTDLLVRQLYDPAFMTYINNQIGDVWPMKEDEGKGQYMMVRAIVDNMLLEEFGIQR